MGVATIVIAPQVERLAQDSECVGTMRRPIVHRPRFGRAQLLIHLHAVGTQRHQSISTAILIEPAAIDE
jgi:hypothetical protein